MRSEAESTRPVGGISTDAGVISEAIAEAAAKPVTEEKENAPRPALDPEFLSCILQPPIVHHDPNYVGMRRIVLYRKAASSAVLDRRQEWRCNGIGYVAYRGIIRRPKNWEYMAISNQLSTSSGSGLWAPSPNPPLGLEIVGASAINTIGPEFLGCSSAAFPAAFPKLEFLIFSYMRNWEEWWLCEGEEEANIKLLFPTLRECTLSRCFKLRGLPENLYGATNLKKIVVSSRDLYIRREYSRHHSILRLSYDPSKGPPNWVTEFVKEELKVAPFAPRKILFYLSPYCRQIGS